MVGERGRRQQERGPQDASTRAQRSRIMRAFFAAVVARGLAASRNAASSTAPPASTATPATAPTRTYCRLEYSTHTLLAMNASGNSGYHGTRNGRGTVG